MIGSISEKHADITILTDDNSRKEKPINIINDILTECNKKEKIRIIPDKNQAIVYTISHVTYADSILITGKEHENYQIFGNNHEYYSDQIIVSYLLGTKI